MSQQVHVVKTAGTLFSCILYLDIHHPVRRDKVHVQYMYVKLMDKRRNSNEYMKDHILEQWRKIHV